MNWLQEHSLFVVLTFFMAFAVWESIQSSSGLNRETVTRWLNNAGFEVINRIIGHFISPLILVWIALVGNEYQLGLFNQYSTHPLLVFSTGILVLDLVTYWTHRAFHQFDPLWRIHQVHHCDLQLDITSSWRFHPLEFLIRIMVSISMILLLGLPPQLILLRYVLTSIVNYYSHAHIKLPTAVLQVMQLILITPTLHRIHHTIPRSDHDSNYGVIFSIWDRLFGTLKTKLSDGNSLDHIGLKEYPEMKQIAFLASLWMPFTRRSIERVSKTDTI